MKACVCETTENAIPVIEKHLPPGIRLVGRLVREDTGSAMIHLEGDGLPEWCYLAQGAQYPRAVVELLDSGELRFVPGSGLPVEQIPPEFQASTER